jgi:type II secretion system protein H
MRRPAQIARTTPTRGFTLIELILVMAILAIAVAYTAPVLAHFFRGRSLDSEARRLLALTREAQSRAVSEGIPVDVWIDTGRGSFGVEAEPSYTEDDPRAQEFQIEADLRLELTDRSRLPELARNTQTSLPQEEFEPETSQGVKTEFSSHPALPRIRFLPDGTIDPDSPGSVRLVGRDENGITLTQSRIRMNYEITRAQ